MTAAGRSSYIPVMRIMTHQMVEPRIEEQGLLFFQNLDQFYDLIEQGMQAATN